MGFASKVNRLAVTVVDIAPVPFFVQLIHYGAIHQRLQLYDEHGRASRLESTSVVPELERPRMCIFKMRCLLISGGLYTADKASGYRFR
jgi:hypothetical protein